MGSILYRMPAISRALKEIIVSSVRTDDASPVIEYMETHYSLNTRITKSYPIRTLAAEHGASDQYIAALTPNMDELDAYRKNSVEQALDRKKIIDVSTDTIDAILVDVKNMYGLLAFLQMVSGRRYIEIIQAPFVKRTRYVISSVWLAKKRGREGDFDIFIPITADTFMFKLNLFRDLWRKKEVVDSSVSMLYNRYLKRLYGSDMKSHVLRAVYVELMYRFYNVARVPKAITATRVLNLKPGTSSALHYDYIHIEDKENPIQRYCPECSRIFEEEEDLLHHLDSMQHKIGRSWQHTGLLQERGELPPEDSYSSPYLNGWKLPNEGYHMRER